MGVSISGNNMTVPGTATIATLALSGGMSLSALTWTPKTAVAVSVNGVAFTLPAAVILLTFAPADITALDVTGKSLTVLDIGGLTALVTLTATNNALPEAQVDAILADLDASGVVSGTVDLSGGTNAAPSAAGLASKASLVTKGWTVTHT